MCVRYRDAILDHGSALHIASTNRGFFSKGVVIQHAKNLDRVVNINIQLLVNRNSFQ